MKYLLEIDLAAGTVRCPDDVGGILERLGRSYQGAFGFWASKIRDDAGTVVGRARLLEGVPSVEAAAACAAALGDRLHGIAWPCASDCDDSLPFVERCGEAGVYDEDIHAALALCELLGPDARVMFAPLHNAPEHGDWQANLQPFVLAPTAAGTVA